MASKRRRKRVRTAFDKPKNKKDLVATTDYKKVLTIVKPIDENEEAKSL